MTSLGPYKGSPRCPRRHQSTDRPALRMRVEAASTAVVAALLCCAAWLPPIAARDAAAPAWRRDRPRHQQDQFPSDPPPGRLCNSCRVQRSLTSAEMDYDSGTYVGNNSMCLKLMERDAAASHTKSLTPSIELQYPKPTDGPSSVMTSTLRSRSAGVQEKRTLRENRSSFYSSRVSPGERRTKFQTLTRSSFQFGTRNAERMTGTNEQLESRIKSSFGPRSRTHRQESGQRMMSRRSEGQLGRRIETFYRNSRIGDNRLYTSRNDRRDTVSAPVMITQSSTERGLEIPSKSFSVLSSDAISRVPHSLSARRSFARQTFTGRNRNYRNTFSNKIHPERRTERSLTTSRNVQEKRSLIRDSSKERRLEQLEKFSLSGSNSLKIMTLLSTERRSDLPDERRLLATSRISMTTFPSSEISRRQAYQRSLPTDTLRKYSGKSREMVYRPKERFLFTESRSVKMTDNAARNSRESSTRKAVREQVTANRRAAYREFEVLTRTVRSASRRQSMSNSDSAEDIPNGRNEALSYTQRERRYLSTSNSRRGSRETSSPLKTISAQRRKSDTSKGSESPLRITLERRSSAEPSSSERLFGRADRTEYASMSRLRYDVSRRLSLHNHVNLERRETGVTNNKRSRGLTSNERRLKAVSRFLRIYSTRRISLTKRQINGVVEPLARSLSDASHLTDAVKRVDQATERRFERGITLTSQNYDQKASRRTSLAERRTIFTERRSTFSATETSRSQRMTRRVIVGSTSQKDLLQSRFSTSYVTFNEMNEQRQFRKMSERTERQLQEKSPSDGRRVIHSVDRRMFYETEKRYVDQSRNYIERQLEPNTNRKFMYRNSRRMTYSRFTTERLLDRSTDRRLQSNDFRRRFVTSFPITNRLMKNSPDSTTERRFDRSSSPARRVSIVKFSGVAPDRRSLSSSFFTKERLLLATEKQLSERRTTRWALTRNIHHQQMTERRLEGIKLIVQTNKKVQSQARYGERDYSSTILYRAESTYRKPDAPSFVEEKMRTIAVPPSRMARQSLELSPTHRLSDISAGSSVAPSTRSSRRRLTPVTKERHSFERRSHNAATQIHRFASSAEQRLNRYSGARSEVAALNERRRSVSYRASFRTHARVSPVPSAEASLKERRNAFDTTSPAVTLRSMEIQHLRDMPGRTKYHNQRRVKATTDRSSRLSQRRVGLINGLFRSSVDRRSTNSLILTVAVVDKRSRKQPSSLSLELAIPAQRRSTSSLQLTDVRKLSMDQRDRKSAMETTAYRRLAGTKTSRSRTETFMETHGRSSSTRLASVTRSSVDNDRRIGIRSLGILNSLLKTDHRSAHEMLVDNQERLHHSYITVSPTGLSSVLPSAIFASSLATAEEAKLTSLKMSERLGVGWSWVLAVLVGVLFFRIGDVAVGSSFMALQNTSQQKKSIWCGCDGSDPGRVNVSAMLSGLTGLLVSN